MFELGEVWDMRDHLAAGSILLVVIDGGRGRHIHTPTLGGLSLSMSAGALRLAAATGAVVIPCLMRSGRFFSLTLSLGEPLPARAVQDGRSDGALCALLFGEFLPTLTAAPEECSRELLGSLHGSTVGAEPAWGDGGAPAAGAIA